LVAVSAHKSGTFSIDNELIKEVIKYNEIDVRSLFEIINYLRKSH
jgi:uncharacterized protein YprB with RNaseH-like and TPR domain